MTDKYNIDGMKPEKQYGSCKEEDSPGSHWGNYPTCPTGAKGANIPQEGCSENQEAGSRLEKWYDNYEVMRMFHISQRTLQTLRSNGKLPFAKLGNKCFYREHDLQMMMMESFRDSRVKFSDQSPDTKKGGGSWR